MPYDDWDYFLLQTIGHNWRIENAEGEKKAKKEWKKREEKKKKCFEASSERKLRVSFGVEETLTCVWDCSGLVCSDKKKTKLEARGREEDTTTKTSLQ